ncbi:MAG: 5-formyltetrahydrofolate cyclo-ligase [Candidatus Omnitrophota bacterium]|nr:5-formyltetrahydrofolate cyclo-ligase [Candidatus Omnitrophota bacterium]
MSIMSIKTGCCERLTKKQIRSKILLRLKTQKEEDRDRKSKIIKRKLFRTPVFKKAKIAMFYMSFDGEVNTQEMIKETRRLGKIVAVPVCKGNRVTLRPCILRNNAKLKKGPYGICEPAVKKYIKLEDLDLVIVPGIAFDKKGNRLGRGRGCYDYFLKRLTRNTASIGLAFDFQILPSLPATTTDVRIEKVIFA